MAGYRIWQSGDEFLVQFEGGPEITFSRAELASFADAAAALAFPGIRKLPKKERDAIVGELYPAGATVSEIQRRTGLTGAGVYRVLERLGIPARNQAMSKAISAGRHRAA